MKQIDIPERKLILASNNQVFEFQDLLFFLPKTHVPKRDQKLV